jgi:hypothetical protein
VAPSILKKLAIISPTSGCRSVGIVRSRTQTMEFSLVLVLYAIPVSPLRAACLSYLIPLDSMIDLYGCCCVPLSWSSRLGDKFGDYTKQTLTS